MCRTNGKECILSQNGVAAEGNVSAEAAILKIELDFVS